MWPKWKGRSHTAKISYRISNELYGGFHLALNVWVLYPAFFWHTKFDYERLFPRKNPQRFRSPQDLWCRLAIVYQQISVYHLWTTNTLQLSKQHPPRVPQFIKNLESNINMNGKKKLKMNGNEQMRRWEKVSELQICRNVAKISCPEQLIKSKLVMSIIDQILALANWNFQGNIKHIAKHHIEKVKAPKISFINLCTVSCFVYKGIFIGFKHFQFQCTSLISQKISNTFQHQFKYVIFWLWPYEKDGFKFDIYGK